MNRMVDENLLIGGSMVELLTVILAAAGAINWAAADLLDTDLLLDVVGLEAGSGTLTAVYVIIAASAAVVLYNELVYQEFITE